MLITHAYIPVDTALPSFNSHISPMIQLLPTHSPRQMSHFEALLAKLRAVAPLAPSAAGSKAPAVKKDMFGSFKVNPPPPPAPFA